VPRLMEKMPASVQKEDFEGTLSLYGGLSLEQTLSGQLSEGHIFGQALQVAHRMAWLAGDLAVLYSGGYGLLMLRAACMLTPVEETTITAW